MLGGVPPVPRPLAVRGWFSSSVVQLLVVEGRRVRFAQLRQIHLSSETPGATPQIMIPDGVRPPALQSNPPEKYAPPWRAMCLDTGAFCVDARKARRATRFTMELGPRRVPVLATRLASQTWNIGGLVLHGRVRPQCCLRVCPAERVAPCVRLSPVGSDSGDDALPTETLSPLPGCKALAVVACV